MFLTLSYLIFFVSFITVGFLMELNKFFFMISILILFHLFFYQIKKLDIGDTEDCLRKFKSNNFLGFSILISLIVGKI